MGLYNRDYYRNSDHGDTWGIEALTPVVKYLILANVAVFLLQIFVVRDDAESRLAVARKQNPMLDQFLTAKESGDREAMEKFRKTYPGLDQGFPDEAFDGILAGTLRPSIIQEWFELDTTKVVYGGQVWRLLTHAFCHDRAIFWHILFNMLCLYWFGPTLESMYGPREFLRFYLLAALVAGLAFVALDLRTGSTIPGIGASGAVLAVMMLYTMHYPRETIRVFWLVPAEMRWIMLGYLIWTVHPVLLALSGEHVFPGIAHVAHLGGLAFGFMYHHFQWRLENLTA